MNPNVNQSESDKWRTELVARAANGDAASETALEVVAEAEVALLKVQMEKLAAEQDAETRKAAIGALVGLMSYLLRGEKWMAELRAIRSWRDKYAAFADEVKEFDEVMAKFAYVRKAVEAFANTENL